MDFLSSLKGVLVQISKMRMLVIFMLGVIFFGWVYKEPISRMLNLYQPLSLEKTNGRDVIIYGVLTDMLKEFNGGRAYIYTFHNGQNFLSKDPATKHKQRTSMDYEVMANGVEGIALNMQNIPVSLFALQLEAILREEILGVNKDGTKDLAARQMMEQIGSSHAAVLPYKDVNENVIMMIGVDWILQGELFFPKSRFRKYVQSIGDIFMGYTDDSKMWNLRGGSVRGTEGEINQDEELISPVLVASSHEHYLSANKSLPRSDLYKLKTTKKVD